MWKQLVDFSKQLVSLTRAVQQGKDTLKTHGEELKDVRQELKRWIKNRRTCMALEVTELEERLMRLEAEVEALKQERADIAPAPKPWWEQISGVFKDSPEFEEAVRLGREWREAQRMEYDEDEPRTPKETHGSA